MRIGTESMQITDMTQKLNLVWSNFKDELFLFIFYVYLSSFILGYLYAYLSRFLGDYFNFYSSRFGRLLYPTLSNGFLYAAFGSKCDFTPSK